MATAAAILMIVQRGRGNRIGRGRSPEHVHRPQTDLHLLGAIRLFALPALFLLLPTAQTITMVGVYAVILSALGSAGYAPILIFLNERFPTAIRATGTGLSWNIGFAIGGMMPTAVSLVAKTPASCR